MACLGTLPEVVRRVEYDTATNSLVDVLRDSSASGKAVVAQVAWTDGSVFQLLSDKS